METQIKKRAEELLEKLTLDEKIGMIHGAQLFQTAGVARLGIPPLKMSDGPMGVRQEFEPDRWNTVGHSDDYVTYLPCNSALAATWNRKLAYEMGSVLGEEARGRGKDVILAPGVNIKRSPLCGRSFEYFSEDPYLTKEMAVPYIQGVQMWDVAACVKHYAVNNQETGRLWVDVEIDEQVLRDIYLPAFYDAVTKGGAYTIMGAYNKLYVEHCCQSDFLLHKILREEWGYDGVVISDWGAVHDTQKAALSQLDIEMSVTYDFDDYFMAGPLKKMIQAGEISETIINEKVVRILLLMMRLHMLDGERKAGAYNTKEHRQIALEVARESVVLLKNEKNHLPLKKEELKSVLLVGENADCLHSGGGGSAEIKALYEISPLMGLKTHLGGNVKVGYTQGYCREEKSEVSHGNWQETSLENDNGPTKPYVHQSDELEKKRKQLRSKAIQLAKEYETVMYIGGLNHDLDCEGNDREDMKLPYEQDILIQELLKVKSDLIVVIIGGSPVEMNTWIRQANTVVWGWYAGMEGGNALAEVLLGEVNPSGKLPETYYKTHRDCSANILGKAIGDKKVVYHEGKYVGYRYYDKYHVEPQYCFGHGLSYTSFEYRSLSVDRIEKKILCYVKNTGNVAGGEIIQVYKRSNENEEFYFRELIGFEKEFLEAGEEKQIYLNLETEIEKGCELLVGSSSKDIRLTGIFDFE